MPSLTDEQKTLVRNVVANVKKGNDQITTFSGYAGTGKTVCLSFISQIFPNFAVCAYTGKATNVLRKKGMHADTIHGLIYEPYTAEDGETVWGLATPWQIASKGIEGFIVDEASMVSKEIHDDLVSFGLPIIYVGDHGQLEPIGTPFNIMQNPMYRLETVHRNAGEIAHFAEHLRKGNPATQFKGAKMVQVVRESAVEDRHLAGVDQIICAFNKTRVKLNERVRNEKKIQYTFIAKGEKIICLRNKKTQNLFNGMQGTVTKIGKNDRFDFVSDGKYFSNVHYDPDQFGRETNQFEFSQTPNPFDYAYAITAHKCLHPDTLVETEEGLLPISKVKPIGVVATPSGPRGYKNVVENPTGKALRLVTKHGYEITMTPDHRMEVWDGSKFTAVEAQEAKIDQFVRLRIGSMIEPISPTLPDMPQGDVRARLINKPEFGTDLCEFLGLMVADGTIFNRGFRLAKRHVDVLERFEFLVESLFSAKARRVWIGKTQAVEVSSTILTQWLRMLGGLTPHNKDIPECILRSPSLYQTAFLRGLMEDGTVNMKGNKTDHIEFSCHCPPLLSKVKTLLLRLGIVSSSAENKLYLYGENANIFTSKIGFVSKFKNKRLRLGFPPSQKNSVIPVSKEESEKLRGILSKIDLNNVRQRGYISKLKARTVEFFHDRMEYHYEKIKLIETTSCPSMCLEVPDGHRFLQNGFPFWNSQGDEFGSVIAYEQRCDKWDHVRWAYTVASRAKKTLIWIGIEEFHPSYL